MVQLSLPKNSEIKKGKYFKDKTGSKNLCNILCHGVMELRPRLIIGQLIHQL